MSTDNVLPIPKRLRYTRAGALRTAGRRRGRVALACSPVTDLTAATMRAGLNSLRSRTVTRSDLQAAPWDWPQHDFSKSGVSASMTVYIVAWSWLRPADPRRACGQQAPNQRADPDFSNSA